MAAKGERARARSTSGKDCFGWPTPNAIGDTTGGGQAKNALNIAKGKKRPSGAAYSQKLRDYVLLAHWPSPAANMMAEITPERARELGWEWNGASYTRPDGSKVQTVLTHAAMLASPRATPASADAVGSHGGGQNTSLRTQSGLTPNGSLAPTEKRGQLNPAFSLWLMGYPTEWGRCAERVTLSSRK